MPILPDDNGGGSTPTSNYNDLSNKPSINSITLTGNKTGADLSLQSAINASGANNLLLAPSTTGGQPTTKPLTDLATPADIETHNTSNAAHPDIRTLIDGRAKKASGSFGTGNIITGLNTPVADIGDSGVALSSLATDTDLADAIAQEVIDRNAAIAQEALDRSAAIATEVIDRDHAIATHNIATSNTHTALLAKYLGLKVITCPAGLPSSAAGTMEYNIWKIDDIHADNPTISVEHRADGLTPMRENNFLFCIGTTSPNTQSVRPSLILKYTADGWQVKQISGFVYRSANTESVNVGIYTPAPPTVSGLNNTCELSYPAPTIGDNIRGDMLFSINAVAITGNISAQYAGTNVQVMAKNNGV